MATTPRRSRLPGWLSLALVTGMLGLAACSLGPAGAHVPTAAEILQNATNVLNVNGTASAKSGGSATVNDLTFTMKLSMDMNLTSSTLGTQKLSETVTASGKETLSPRRAQMDTTMNLAGLPRLGQTSSGGHALTMSIIVDYASTTGYIKMSGLGFLPGSSPDTWYSMSYASLGGFGADTSMYMDYSKLKDATLVGSETLNGVAVWHLRAKEDVNQSLSGLGGTATGSAGSSSVGVNATTDYYFRQDNYRPVKVVITGTDTISGMGTMTVNTEMDFTSFNSGISITLPAANEVKPLPNMIQPPQ